MQEKKKLNFYWKFILFQEDVTSIYRVQPQGDSVVT